MRSLGSARQYVFFLFGLIILGHPLGSIAESTVTAEIQTLSLDATHHMQTGSRLQQTGFYLDAQNHYQLALNQAEQRQDSKLIALAKSALGYSQYLLHRPERALPLLRQAILEANQTQQEELAAITQFYAGLAEQHLKHRFAAEAAWQQALSFAERSQNAELTARCHLAFGQAAIDESKLTDHLNLAQQALDMMPPGSPHRAELRLLLVKQWLKHPTLSPLSVTTGREKGRLAKIYNQLQHAIAETNDRQVRVRAQYHALMGETYESQGRYQEAAQLTQQALEILDTVRAEDLRIFYEWQNGRIQHALNHDVLALAAYHRAISALQSIRQDIPIIYQDGKSSFLELFGPLYRETIQLILAQPTTSHTEQSTLLEVRVLMEQLKQTELEEFFNDRCLLANVEANAQPSQQPQVAVFYPILLEDRTELLLGIGDHLYRHTLAISGKQIEQEVRYYADKLRKRRASSLNRKLYDELIRPFRTILEQHQIDTLLYVPDGALRLMPLASLHDGQRYLVERFALSVVPSLALLPSYSTEQPDQETTLLSGLSQPNPDMLQQLPKKLHRVLNGGNPETNAERAIEEHPPVRAISQLPRDLLINTIRAKDLTALSKALALPGVENEVENLAKLVPNKAILNQAFTLQSFDQNLSRSPISIVHIASHGYFGGTSEESFIMTYDKLLEIDHLETLLKSRAEQRPIELVVLSACQTAEGDDRAPLGLSGVTLKAKARNALGSLWPISDQAAVNLMQSFYTGFSQQKLTKVKALQQAQLKLLHDPETEHPFYWAPFVLVGNGQ